MPLCDDPLEQLTFFPKDLTFPTILVGENPEWVFSGTSLAGLISKELGFDLRAICGAEKLEPNCVYLALDSGEEASNIDIRRIVLANADRINPENVLGSSSFRKLEERKPEILTGSLTEMSTVISKRLRRFTRN